MQVFSDFDGTISIEDATDFILTRFADSQWLQIEEEWKEGKIGSAECMRRQIALIRATKQQLDNALDEVSIDESFIAFSAFCAAQEIPLTVISDGVDYFIRQILSGYELEHLPIMANQLTIHSVKDHTAYQLSSPFSSAACSSASGVCKCRAVQSSDMRIYIGDGRSDFCVSDKPDLVFAKGKLAQYCQEKGTPYIPYYDFDDVTRVLRDTLPNLLPNAPAEPVYAFV